MLVVDASVVVTFLLHPDEVVNRLRAGGALHAPAHLDVEVASEIRRTDLSGRLSAGRGTAAIADLQAIPVRRWPIAPLLGRAWELRANVSSYDAVYVALAEGLDCPLLTRDARLAGAPGLRTRIEVV
ncbi:type II toxin-antitoxin system VapC family toxin [Cellulomonas sp. JH27-2]|uniref:type II toxin-antitoxin system VapC family toxin n=1 Tax=Cellulomonas sp. JH27-2 TaxID=2774139 RepID=UPI001783F0A4|nr:type II toxin-antitoxin system VapC family toxin [Cellulomonas sp. JH27-2]